MRLLALPSCRACLAIAGAVLASAAGAQSPLSFLGIHWVPQVLRAAPEIEVRVLGNPIAVPAAMKAERVYVPLRGAFEKLGAKVDYDPTTRVATVTRQGRSDEVPLLGTETLNGQTMVPLRLIAESIGGHVEWAPFTRTASVETSSEGTNIVDQSGGGALQTMTDLGGATGSTAGSGTIQDPTVSYAPDAARSYIPDTAAGYVPDVAGTFTPLSGNGEQPTSQRGNVGESIPPAETAQAPSGPLAWIPWTLLAFATVAAVAFFLMRRRPSGRVIASTDRK